MTKNPYINALAAGAYIIFIVLLLSFGPAFVRDEPDTIFAPIAMLSLLVLSVAFMGYTFFLQPILMFLEGQKREAVELVTKTIVTFATLTAIVVVAAFSI